MKKKSLGTLSLSKKTVSNLNGNDLTGGRLIAPPTFYNCGTQINGCNSRNVCETIEVDRRTLPIC
ncbi:class I lanthipeptide [Flavobacteriaceae bacterium M23B6Z8]